MSESKQIKKSAPEEPKPKRKTKPKIEIDLKQVESLASRGLTNEQVALALGISPGTLYARKRENEEFEEAIKSGQAKGLTEISNALYEEAKKGNVTAMIFYLKARGGWSDKQVIEIPNEIKVSVKQDIKQLSTEELLELARMNENKRNTMDSGGDS